MPSFNDLLSQGAAHAWLYIPVAILLGALHGLEPGHSKTMMAAFIVAVRGTIPQAVLLGISAAFSHSLIIWLLAAVALRFGSRWNAETTEPYFQLASGLIIVGLAVWMFFRTRREDRAAADHHHGGDGSHGGQMINTGHGCVEVSVFETNTFQFREHRHAELDLSDGDYQDAHERAHASEIARRFAHRNVTTGQIVLFGLTGGLLPCPAALTVLLVCMQLKQFTLGFVLVLAFSVGLALTMVAVGTAAAWSVQHASKRIKGFGEFARKAPYFSSAVLVCLGLYIGSQGWLHLR